MSKVKDVLKYMNEIAPFETAMSWDNVGLLIGNENDEVTNCVLALDVNQDVLDYTIEQKANLIITHHPVIFSGLKKITSNSLVYKIIQNNISVISAHTNLDIAVDGVNYALADALKLVNQRDLENTGGIGRIGELAEEMQPLEFAKHIKDCLPAESISYTNYNKPIKTVVVVGGEGSDFAFSYPKADAYVSGEIKHHVFIEAQNNEKQIFAVGHYESEVCILGPLSKKMSCIFNDIDFQNYLIWATRFI